MKTKLFGALSLAILLGHPAQAAERNWSYSYNDLGLIESADGPRTDVQDVTRYSYDAKGNLTAVTNALGHVTRLADHDERGNPGTLTDANGVISTLTYSGIDARLASIGSVGSTTRFEYDAVGQITRLTRGDGSWLAYTYDDARRLVAIANNLGERLEYDVDAQGNRTAQRLKDASGSLVRQQQWVYDELGRLLRSVGAAGQTHRYRYDLNDNPTGRTNPRQYASTQAFDALDRLVSHTDALDGVTQLTYDAQDNLTQVSDPRGVTTRYVYDGLGNLIQRISPDSGTTHFEYDAAGNVIRQTDARGVVVEFSYDALNRLSERRYPATPAFDVRYQYDGSADGNHGIGRLTAIKDGSGRLAYRYDARGNLVQQARSLSINGQVLEASLSFQYDAADRLVGIGYPSGYTLGYPRNAGGQVSSVTLGVGSQAPLVLASDIAYLPFGPLQRLSWANGISLAREYDQDYQLVRQRVGPWQSDYRHDANGNITQLAHSLWGTLDYQYDPLDRLTTERSSRAERRYGYDAMGNRTEKSATRLADGESLQDSYRYASDSNRLTALNGHTVTSDAAGNLLQDRASRLLGYDAQGRLANVRIDGQEVAQYRYNAHGQRIAKLTAQGFTTYLYGPDGQLLGEATYDRNGQPRREQYYLWLDRLPLATLSTAYDDQGHPGNPRVLYLHSDHLDTPRLASDDDQRLAWQWQSDAFGNGQPSSPDNTVVNLRFPGQYYDAESGLHYNYFRDYDPQTGRYVESDPIGLEGGLNTYGYVDANPLILIDPLGLNPVAGCAVGGAVGGPVGCGIGTAVNLIGMGIAYGMSGNNDAESFPQWSPMGEESWPDRSEQKEAESCPRDADCYQLGLSIDILVQTIKMRRIQMHELGGDPGHRQKEKILRQRLGELVRAAKARNCPYNPEANLLVL
ncbi:RHS repeat-associated core domain-containing protein [Pseudomonas citronellolis]|uniref:RHS repeat-associated core domain-containing protein n=1 Tax=Pseudomonas citronellolis TaxID=53408 RepID=UPI0009EE20F2|nr:RHS repeat-associated core domain-containing protein [Pseudomonas citronellolis]